MEFKQLQSFTAVVQYRSFTKAAEKLYTSQPTISAHIRSLEEEFNTRLILRTTKSLEITSKGLELYECAAHILDLRDNLLLRWSEGTKTILHLGASTIPSAYILPEVLPEYGKLQPDTYFVIHQGDSGSVADGILNGLFDIGIIGMRYENELLSCKPFYKDHMVLITPVNEHFLKLQQRPEVPIRELLNEPIILREKGSGSLKSADHFLESLNITEDQLKVTARINDQESIKNLVAGGLGVSIISEKAVADFARAKRLLIFALPGNTAERDLCLLTRRDLAPRSSIERFADFVLNYYR